MRVWHTIFAVFFVAIALTIARDPAGRVGIVVFVAGTVTFVCALIAVMLLFQTIGSIGDARGPLEYIQSMMATGIVLLLGSGVMLGVLFACLSMIRIIV